MYILAATLVPGFAIAAQSNWADAGNAQLRLLALPANNGTISAGIEIALSPGWHTYWRNPGDAGVPPRFDFSRSENVASVAVRYPTPERLDDATSVSAVYSDQVTFPLVVTVMDPASETTLRVDASFGVCNDVCIPAQAQAELALPQAGDDDALAKATLSHAAERLPGSPAPGRFQIESVASDGPDALAITVRMPPSSYADLFVDGPEGWSVGEPKLLSRDATLSRYRLSLTGRPQGLSISGQTFRFVAVSGMESIEQAVRVP